MNSALLENFQASCTAWNGYKPCQIQKSEGRPDCQGCTSFELGEVVLDARRSEYDNRLLATADHVGIVEMGGMGSILRTSAVTRAIRTVNPAVTIHWFTHHRGSQLLKYIPGVRAIDVETNDVEDLIPLIESIDLIINFEFTLEAKVIVSHAKMVAGFTLNAQGKFHGVSPYGEYFQRMQIDDAFRWKNRLTMQQVLLESVGLPSSDPQYDVVLAGENLANARRVLRSCFKSEVPTKLIGLNIGTSENGLPRRWPAEHHAALANQLSVRHPDAGFLILSGPQDQEARDAVLTGLQQAPNVGVSPADMEVGDFVGLVGQMDLLVTANSFALHAARSQGIRILTFENPLPPQEMELGPDDVCMQPQLPCGPCYNRCVNEIFAQCMKSVSADEVATTVESSIF